MNNINDILISNLKDLFDRVEGKDKCLICETIHVLENSKANESDGNFWIVLLFLIFFGFNNSSKPLFDEGFLKIMQEVLEKRNSENEEEEMQ